MKSACVARASISICLITLLLTTSASAQVVPDAPEPLLAVPAAIDFSQFPQRLAVNPLPPIVPTDVTGIGGGLGHAQGLLESIFGPGAPAPRIRRPVPPAPRDARYAFTGLWIPFSAPPDRIALLTGQLRPQHLSAAPPQGRRLVRAVVFPPASARSRGRISRQGGGESVFMPTTDSAFSLLNESTLFLRQGAVLVRAGSDPVLVTADAGGHRYKALIEDGSLALVTVMDGNFALANFIDTRRDAVHAYAEGGTLSAPRVVDVKIGQLVQFRSPQSPGAPLPVSSFIFGRALLDSHLGVQLSRLDYLRAIRMFNLDIALPESEFNELLKTAAAVAQVTRAGAL